MNTCDNCNNWLSIGSDLPEGYCKHFRRHLFGKDKACLHFTDSEAWHDCVTAPEEDAVNSPAHYQHYPLEVIEIIRLVLDQPECEDLTQYQAYCLGTELKYRLRTGLKDEYKVLEDIGKSMWFRDRRKGVVNATA